MLEYIRGILKEIRSNCAIVEAHGLGYKLYIPQNLVHANLSLETEVLFYISEVIREDLHALYGFAKKDARDLFEKLCEVSGIGPKTALALIGHFADVPSLLSAIYANDTLLLSKVPGIGKKTAERLIVELRDKTFSFAPTIEIKNTLFGDAVSALISLGLSDIKAKAAVQKALKEFPTENLAHLITKALQCRT